MAKTDTKKQSFNPRIFLTTRRSLAIALGVGLVAIGILFFGIIPQFQEALSLREELSDEQPKLERLQRKLVELENIQFSPEFSQREIVDGALPSKKPLLELLTSLNTIAVTNNVAVSEFSLTPGLISTSAAELQAGSRSNAVGGVDTIPVEMVVAGTFDNVGNFLLDLEKISPFTTITQLALTSQNNADDFSTEATDMQARLVTESYFFTQSVTAAVEAPLPALNQREQQVLEELTAFSQVDLPDQIEVTGGGLEDLFGVDPLDFNN